jgi:vancomycin resistance protein YoaR
MVIREQTPVSVNVEDTAQLAENILSQPFTINPADPSAGQGPWTIEPEALASLLTIEQKEVKGNRSYTLTVNRAALVAYITSIAPGLQKEPVNARMMFNDDTRQLELIASAVVGTSVDIEQSVDSVLEKMQGGEHQASLVMQTVDPAVKDTSQATELGITELVAETTSYFYGSDAARVQNIRTAAASFHGVMVGPGEVFSMAEYLTDISLDNGYAEAPIIVGDQTVDGVGGGICQVSTTVFRNAFYGGFPIVERHPHAYRVGYYEQQSNGWVDNNLAGLDATVYVPLVDFKFRNDTPYWLLMETYPTNNSLTWKFYSTGVGREVDWWTTGITNVITPPDPIYREDPTLPSGTIKQVDWAVNGASVEVYRTVKVNGEITLQDTIRTTYVAWPAGFTYGPGTEIP